MDAKLNPFGSREPLKNAKNPGECPKSADFRPASGQADPNYHPEIVLFF
jgi:hypothetical protein